jgi:hypothetical protein
MWLGASPNRRDGLFGCLESTPSSVQAFIHFRIEQRAYDLDSKAYKVSMCKEQRIRSLREAITASRLTSTPQILKSDNIVIHFIRLLYNQG